MDSLILVPIGNTYVNPEEILHIGPQGIEGCYISFKVNPVALYIPLPVEEVIQRLKVHFTPLP